MKIIGIVGSRRRDSEADFNIVKEEFLKHFEKGDYICSGLCSRGADRFAVLLAEEYSTPILWYPAEWGKFGRIAGFKRNAHIAENSDILIACVASDRTGGTEDTIRRYKKLGKSKLFIV